MSQNRYIPAFNVPRPVSIMIGAWLGVYLIFIFAPRDITLTLVNWLALIPLRFFGETQNITLGLINLISYSFVHGGGTHLVLNAVWFLAFATPIARRFSATRFLLFYLSGVVIAAITQLLATGADHPTLPIVGASGGVAACMGGALRFAFPEGRFFDARAATHRRLLPLRDLWKHRIVVIFTILWVGLNVIFGVLGPLGMGSPSGESVLVAWQAHLGGFFGGLILMSIFDPPPLSPSGGPGNVDYGNWR